MAGEEIRAHHFRIAIWMGKHEYVRQLVQFTVLVCQLGFSSLSVVVVKKDDGISRWHEAPVLTKGFEILEFSPALSNMVDLMVYVVCLGKSV